MNNQVKCFKNDKWEIVDATTLVADDMIFLRDRTYIVTDKPYEFEGKTHIPAKIYEPGVITIALGEKGVDYLHMAMDYTMSSLTDFKDGTFMICDLFDNAFVYSPRLPKDELNEFCKKHIDKYEAFFRKNGYDKYPNSKIKQVEIEKFW
ncbi:hypothetical protein NI385_27835 (plasmid) [Vibrio parahaemolyticus]|uniref:hypothetical protein n=1 Tax=Vibrio TaxID=662 RepID=UPI0005F139E0|nr:MULTISPECIES: hypothetical protein [Vibrio]EGR2217256.1 hypothetical protein [Vibrio parahaemolyticus]MBE4204917.1 hypothetical protein [Vibrio parahaemolyticus]TBT51077.1 hypothetical protein D5E78_04635 [Vibrio parahaemolyticus]WMN81234.1 hypothetical protein NI385_27835 [Vibrio parahaemolyticus]HDY7671144.1 hypothetical protein [Vibrio vulnificus]